MSESQSQIQQCAPASSDMREKFESYLRRATGRDDARFLWTRFDAARTYIYVQSEWEAWQAAWQAASSPSPVRQGDEAPIDMILHCPKCGMQHVDAPEPAVEHEHGAVEFAEWDNPPHKSHLCHGCGNIWRPADVPTNGVAAIKTKGKADHPRQGDEAVSPVDVKEGAR